MYSGLESSIECHFIVHLVCRNQSKFLNLGSQRWMKSPKMAKFPFSLSICIVPIKFIYGNTMPSQKSPDNFQFDCSKK